jgi:YD repeat-containing protein
MNRAPGCMVAAFALVVAGCGCDGEDRGPGRGDAGIGGADAGWKVGNAGSGGTSGMNGGGASQAGGSAGKEPDGGPVDGGASGTSDAGDGAPSLPSACAAPLDRTVTTSFYEAARCLFEGTDPPQSGVAANAVDRERVAIVHGRVFDISGATLAGVTVKVLGHSELGSSASRDDGAFELAVNGGSSVTVRYEKPGFLPSQRHLATRVRDFTVFPDVALVKLPAASLAVALPSEGDAPLVIDGPMYQDRDGERHEALAFAPGTTATLVLPDGTKQSLESIDVRIAEYTVGEDGKLSMPADLPPNSGYTYAVDYSVDQARAAGATRVELDPPAVSYVENFLHFPAGTVVPRGALDPEMDRWEASANGIVLKVVSVEKGRAAIDVDGDDKGHLRGRTLYLGTGRSRSADAIGPTLVSYAANRGYQSSGDDGPARDASMKAIEGIEVAPDGTVFVADGNADVVRKVSPDGIITRFAGNETTGFGGDGGKALDAQLHYPSGLAVGPDGTLYIADRYNHRVRAVSPNGEIRTVAGNGTDKDSGDGGLATAAGVPNPRDVAVGPDGRLYIAEQVRVRRVDPDGTITTVAGNGGFGIAGAGDGGPATETGFDDIPSIAVSPAGELYLINWARVRKVSTSGIITTVLGGGNRPLVPGVRALDVSFQTLYGVEFAPDGTLYATALDSEAGQGELIVQLGPDGVVQLIGGGGTSQQFINPETNTTPTAVRLHGTHLRATSEGDLYIASNGGVAKIRPALPGFAASEFLIPDEDGRTGYVFDTFGRHLRTLDAVSKVTLLTFSYDRQGRLDTIADNFGNQTHVSRDATGLPVSILGPYDESTTLKVASDGYLASVANANGETTSFEYDGGGLLTSLTNPLGGTSRFIYDSAGRLTKDTEPSGAFQNLARKDETSATVSRGFEPMRRTPTHGPIALRRAAPRPR